MATKLSDKWATPPEFYRFVHRIWAPTIDVCAEPHNAKCKIYIDEAQDGLTTDWVALARKKKVRPVFWCNPGYSDVTPWIDVANEVQYEGGTTLLLAHHNFSAAWFAVASSISSLCLLLTPRIKFIDPSGAGRQAPSGSNCLFVIDPLAIELPCSTQHFDWNFFQNVYPGTEE